MSSCLKPASTLNIIDLETKSLIYSADLLRYRMNPAVTLINSVIYVLGGSDDSGDSVYCETYAIHTKE